MSINTFSTTVSTVESGGFHTCVLMSDQAVQCWGSNTYGQSGHAYTLPTLSQVVQISIGTQHGCALIADGTIRCWGQNNALQLGDATTTNRSTPVAVSGISNARKVVAHLDRSCAILCDPERQYRAMLGGQRIGTVGRWDDDGAHGSYSRVGSDECGCSFPRS